MRFTLNGRQKTIDVHPLKRLLDVLREDCGLTGTKEGCGEGECGACTVLVDNVPVNACLVPAAHVAGTEVMTIEGLGGSHPLQTAFVEHGGAQCGICTPGMIMAAVALGPEPSLSEIRTGLAGNLCRCTGYSAIYRSVQAAAKTRRTTRPPARTSTKRPSTEGTAKTIATKTSVTKTSVVVGTSARRTSAANAAVTKKVKRSSPPARRRR